MIIDDDDRDDGLDPREPICQNLLSTCSKCTAITSRKIEQFHLKHALEDFRQNTDGNMIFLANVII